MLMEKKVRLLRGNRSRGELGEALALKYLKDNKYTIVERNFRNKIGEMDIIAKKDSLIVFVEVKSRSSIKYGYPYEAVNIKKQNKLKLLAYSYIKLHNLYYHQFRFDIIEVYLEDNSINHIENAFWT